MHTYEKRYINDLGGYEIWQLRDDGIQRRVDEGYHGYVSWLTLGNVPPEVPYVAPPSPDPKAIAKQELAQTDQYMARVTEDLIDVLIVKNVITLNDMPQVAREKIQTRKALRAKL